MHFLSKQCLLKMQFLSVDTNIQLLEFFIPSAATPLQPKKRCYVAKCTHVTPNTPVTPVILVTPVNPLCVGWTWLRTLFEFLFSPVAQGPVLLYLKGMAGFVANINEAYMGNKKWNCFPCTFGQIFQVFISGVIVWAGKARKMVKNERSAWLIIIQFMVGSVLRQYFEVLIRSNGKNGWFFGKLWFKKANSAWLIKGWRN